MRDVIQGHKDLWFRDVLYREISPGNILIMSQDKDRPAGCLIDLDHGKKYKKEEMTKAPIAGTDIDDYDVSLVIRRAKLGYNTTLTEAVASRLLAAMGTPEMAVLFINEAKTFWDDDLSYLILKETSNGPTSILSREMITHVTGFTLDAAAYAKSDCDSKGPVPKKNKMEGN
ncbi:hypothetical protein PUNSTDRAFT_45485 [Punctularia strigosozonata HHB-11173 SS5]|uniref:uncharacterized protein n=1 Tax=Punctularia strigosozonata (strain HHB-11173) TaxID=741275 RepID=UPI00044182B0|nr:uncharacterized protein PUNSTDRAFT_45485 [Punctularia strigosozonata HHB-11173 SS5]EIN08097.1 hypothetical protein PUNSTDRAFT_45485 [Punctularia strigosozonata HHB-11173 SS5]